MMFENKIMGMYFTIKNVRYIPALFFMMFCTFSCSVSQSTWIIHMRSPVTGQKHTDKYTGFFPPRKYEKQNHPKNRETEDRYFGV
jgi:hypothetical protein